MNRVSRGLGWLLMVVALVAFVSVFFLPPLSSTFADTGQPDTASITTYRADMDLAQDGTLTTTEDLTVQMPPGKHGIFRIFDTADPRRRDVDHPISGVVVTRDGQDETTGDDHGPARHRDRAHR